MSTWDEKSEQMFKTIFESQESSSAQGNLPRVICLPSLDKEHDDEEAEA